MKTLCWMFVLLFAGSMPAASAGSQGPVEDLLDRVTPVYAISAQDVLSGTTTDVTVEWREAMSPTITIGQLDVDVHPAGATWLAFGDRNETPAFAVSFTIDKESGVPIACFDFTGTGAIRVIEEIDVDGVVGNFRVSHWRVPAIGEVVVLTATKCGCFRGSGTCTQKRCDDNDECGGGTSGSTGQCLEVKVPAV